MRGRLPRRTRERQSTFRDCARLVAAPMGVARYKVTPRAGTHGLCVGPQVERDARLWHVEGSDVSYSVTDRMRNVASQPPGCPRLATAKERVNGIASRGDRPTERLVEPGLCWRAGLRSSRGSKHAPDRTPTVRSDSRDFGPPARRGPSKSAVSRRHWAEQEKGEIPVPGCLPRQISSKCRKLSQRSDTGRTLQRRKRSRGHSFGSVSKKSRSSVYFGLATTVAIP